MSYTIHILTTNTEALTAEKIAEQPRVYKPQDVVVACENIYFKAGSEQLPELFIPVVSFLVRDFFILAHRSGLYNRQHDLWRALAFAAEAQAEQLKEGIVRKRAMPAYDIRLLDYRRRVAVLARICEAGYSRDSKVWLKLLKQLTGEAVKEHFLAGVFLFCESPFPETLITEVRRLTRATDPVARWESRLPAPVSVSLNLVEMASRSTPGLQLGPGPGCRLSFRLVHPDLTVGKRMTGRAVVRDPEA